MLWFNRQAKGNASGKEVVEPVTLEVSFDDNILALKVGELMEAVNEHGGIEAFVEAIETKHQLFARGLTPEALDTMDVAAVTTLLETVFPARRRLRPVVESMDQEALVSAVRELIHGRGELADRMEAFVEAFPTGEDKKARRAAADFGAELLHFRDPERYPLMTRWVWDVNTVSGSAREFIAGNDTMSEIPLGSDPGTYEAVRSALAELLTGQGFYRDLHYLVDLVLAWAYADYMRAMSSSMGLMKSEFGGDYDPTEPARKLLGIDTGPRRQEPEQNETVH